MVLYLLVIIPRVELRQLLKPIAPFVKINGPAAAALLSASDTCSESNLSEECLWRECRGSSECGRLGDEMGAETADSLRNPFQSRQSVLCRVRQGLGRGLPSQRPPLPIPYAIMPLEKYIKCHDVMISQY